MGLLEEAIREHLELKRMRGVDPAELWRQEREALGRGFPPTGAQDCSGGSELEQGGEGGALRAAGSGSSQAEEPKIVGRQTADPSTDERETVELVMARLLAEEGPQGEGVELESRAEQEAEEADEGTRRSEARGRAGRERRRNLLNRVGARRQRRGR